jgi:exodeoxyribonuclease V
MELNTDQRIAVDACAASIRDRERVTRLFGYAGTGKTTIASTVVEEAGLDMYRVQFAAPTGKAAAVLARKLKAYGIGAKTIHSLLYQPPKKVKTCKACGAEDSAYDGKCMNCGKPFVARAGRDQFRWTLDDAKAYAASNFDLLVVDEASMVGTKLGTDIMSLEIPVLAIGDPMQLQPINDKRFFMEEAPNAELSQIMRSGNDVLPLAQDIRLHGIRAAKRYPAISLGRIGQSQALNYSQIIVGKNRTRDLKNRKMRDMQGYSGDMPMVGERIICLRNNYGLGCLNGQQFTITEIHDEQSEYWKEQGMFIAYLECDCGSEYDITSRCVTCGWASNRLMPVWLKGFEGHAGERELADMRYQEGNRAMMATYGYCITAHKSQGSEWPSVLVLNEAWGKESVNWLYTAVTRAQDEVAIISGR